MGRHKKYEEPYPQNLVTELCEGGVQTIEGFSIETEDQLLGLEYALSTLSERTQEVLSYRFKDGLTLREVGAILGLSAERVRQIESKGMRRLRHPKRLKPIRYGLSAYQDVVASAQAEAEARRAQQTSEQAAQLEGAYRRRIGALAPDSPLEDLGFNFQERRALYSVGVHTYADLKASDFKGKLIARNNKDLAFKIEEKLEQLKAMDTDDKRKAADAHVARYFPSFCKLYPTPIEELGLSTRSFNALYRRASIRTIGQVLLMEDDELARVRNLGAGCFREIKDKLQDYAKAAGLCDMKEDMHEDF